MCNWPPGIWPQGHARSCLSKKTVQPIGTGTDPIMCVACPLIYVRFLVLEDNMHVGPSASRGRHSALNFVPSDNITLWGLHNAVNSHSVKVVLAGSWRCLQRPHFRVF